jgi:predicted amidohydrolase
MRAALVQDKPVLGDKEANLEKVAAAVEKVSDDGAEVAMFGEMFLTGYTVRDKVYNLAERLDGPSMGKLKKLSQKRACSIIIGMPERDEKVKGWVYNSAALIDHESGKVSSYRKRQLINFGPFDEKLYFTEGSLNQPVMETELGNFGIYICYDMFFPEIAKSYALTGADWLVCVSAAPTTSRDFFEKIMVARAIENATPVFYVNLVGIDHSLKLFGGSAVVGPRGEVKARAKYLEPDILICDMDPRETEIARQHRPTLRDTKKELFNQEK